MATADLLVKEIRAKLNSNLVIGVENYLSHGVLLCFKNKYNILIVSKNQSSRRVFDLGALKVIYDEDFNDIKQILIGQKPLTKSNTFFLYYIFNAFSIKEKISKKKAKQLYHDLSFLNLKQLFSTYYKLDLDPNRELFLFGDDVLSSRFDRSNDYKIPKRGVMVEVIDDSALLIQCEHDRIVDIDMGNYRDEKYIYYDFNMCEEVVCNESECDYVRYESNSEVAIFTKNILKPGINLSKIKRKLYKKINNKKFLLKQNEEGSFDFYDKNGLIRICHQDLLVYPLRPLKKIP